MKHHVTHAHATEHSYDLFGNQFASFFTLPLLEKNKISDKITRK